MLDLWLRRRRPQIALHLGLREARAPRLWGLVGGSGAPPRGASSVAEVRSECGGWIGDQQVGRGFPNR